MKWLLLASSLILLAIVFVVVVDLTRRGNVVPENSVEAMDDYVKKVIGEGEGNFSYSHHPDRGYRISRLVKVRELGAQTEEIIIFNEITDIKVEQNWTFRISLPWRHYVVPGIVVQLRDGGGRYHPVFRHTVYISGQKYVATFAIVGNKGDSPP